MNIKNNIIIGIILAIISWLLFFLFLSIFLGGFGSSSLGGGMIGIGVGVFVIQIWAIFILFFIPIAIKIIIKKILHSQPRPLEVLFTTLFCFFLISIPFLPQLIIEFIDDIKLEKSIKVTDEFARAYNLATEKNDPTFCDELKTEEWKQKEKETDYDNEGVRTYRKCCTFASDGVLEKKELSEGDKWNFCMKITEYLERQECYSVLLERINPETRIYPINLSCDLINNITIKQECDEINKRTEAEKNAYNSYDSHKIKSYDMSGCDLLRPFQKAICYSFIASTENGFGICSDLSSEIIKTDKPFGDSDKTQQEICEFYRDIRR